MFETPLLTRTEASPPVDDFLDFMKEEHGFSAIVGIPGNGGPDLATFEEGPAICFVTDTLEQACLISYEWGRRHPVFANRSFANPPF